MSWSTIGRPICRSIVHWPTAAADWRRLPQFCRTPFTPPAGAKVWNPGFDVTPHHLIAGIITEKGIFRAPYSETLRGAFEQVGIAELQESQR